MLLTGIFDGFENNRAMVYMTRDSQPMTSGLNLIAGQRETIAALVTPGINAAVYHHLLAHGTDYHILENYNYTAEFSLQEIEYFTHLLSELITTHLQLLRLMKRLRLE